MTGLASTGLVLQDNGGVGSFNSLWIRDSGSNIASQSNVNFGTDAILWMRYVGDQVLVRVDTNRDGVWAHELAASVITTGAGRSGASG